MDGLTILDNQVTQIQKIYHLAVDAEQDRVVITDNQFRYTGTVFASYGDGRPADHGGVAEEVWTRQDVTTF